MASHNLSSFKAQKNYHEIICSDFYLAVEFLKKDFKNFLRQKNIFLAILKNNVEAFNWKKYFFIFLVTCQSSRF